MGWNSWNKFHCHLLNEDLIRGVADTLLQTGLAKAGYVYVNLDGKQGTVASEVPEHA